MDKDKVYREQSYYIVEKTKGNKERIYKMENKYKKQGRVHEIRDKDGVNKERNYKQCGKRKQLN